jgi:hypothetical protein
MSHLSHLRPILKVSPTGKPTTGRLSRPDLYAAHQGKGEVQDIVGQSVV